MTSGRKSSSNILGFYEAPFDRPEREASNSLPVLLEQGETRKKAQTEMLSYPRTPLIHRHSYTCMAP